MSKHYQSSRQKHGQSRDLPPPSFSSSLLDAIYRSLDEISDQQPPEASAIEKKQPAVIIQQSATPTTTTKTQIPGRESKSRARLIHQLTEKTTTETSKIRRTSTDENSRQFHGPKLISSSSSSSRSSSICNRFSSSSDADADAEFLHRSLKPIRTTTVQTTQLANHQPPKKNDNARSRTLTTIYSNLKKKSKQQQQQQQVSPGVRIATFLNSLFSNSTTTKKPTKISPPKSPGNSISNSSSTCSTASSISRSCLSKTPSSAGRSLNPRSVKFDTPVSVIVGVGGEGDHNSRPRGHKINNPFNQMDDRDDDDQDEDEYRVRKIEEATRQLLDKYRDRDGKFNDNVEADEDEDEESEDDLSCCSSDLFELENLMEIGIENYREELPVYGTTCLDHRSNGNGIIV